MHLSSMFSPIECASPKYLKMTVDRLMATVTVKVTVAVTVTVTVKVVVMVTFTLVFSNGVPSFGHANPTL